MWWNIWQVFLLAQTEQEKMITRYGWIFLGLFVGVLLLDAFAKGKLISNKGPLKKILLIVFIIIGLVVLLMNKIYK